MLSSIISVASNVLYGTPILTKPNVANKTDHLGPTTSTPKTQAATKPSGDVISQLNEQNDKLDKIMQKLVKLDQIDHIEEKLEKVSETVAKFNNRISDVERKLTENSAARRPGGEHRSRERPEETRENIRVAM